VTSDERRPVGRGPSRPGGGGEAARDEAARQAAVDPSRNVVLEASAGTGKTRVLVERYLNLLRAGVEPKNILAVTFTRKAASEMRQRIVAALRTDADASPEGAARWRGLRDRLGEIAISTIDAFCLSLLREFPLEADLDPGFGIADDTDVPRLIEESLDDALRVCRARARTDAGVALLFAQLGESRVRLGIAALLERRAMAGSVLGRLAALGPRGLSVEEACRRGAERIAAALCAVPGGLERFIDAGPVGHPRYAVLAAELRDLARGAAAGAAPAAAPERIKGLADRLQAHFFTKAGTARRTSTEYRADHFADPRGRAAYWALVNAAAPAVGDALRGLRRDLNAIQSRAVWQVFSIANERYRRTLEARGVLDFSELLARATALLGNMDEFARSRYLLEARYHHVLVDEFQDTSRAQWELVSLLVRAWGEGLGLAAEAPLPPSIFIVGDRKQSIYRFRDADVRVLDEAAAAIEQLRPEGSPVRSISRSFRSAPPLLAFVNDLFAEIAGPAGRPEAFRFGESDAFPVDAAGSHWPPGPALGLVAAASVRRSADAVAAEIARLAASGQVRDRQSGELRPIRPADVGILFRSRASHREFERALEAWGIPSYVYRGLGFFDADEVKDTVALLRYLADPASDLRAAAFLRSRLVRLSDSAIQRLAPSIAQAAAGRLATPAAVLDPEDARVFARMRSSVDAWLDLADRVPPAELLDRVLAESAYEYELRGPRLAAARENLKKLRGLVRRIQNRGYVTLERLAGVFDRLSAGEESNAVVDAIDAVNLMTVHAAKGLEFPVVFVVNLGRGSGGPRAPIRIAADAPPEDAVAVGDYEAEFDERDAAHERAETTRLLYVAATRGRDRVYLVSVCEDGRFRPRAGSLGEVLPPSFQAVLGEAASVQNDGTAVRWQAASGAAHVFRVCVPPDAPPAGPPKPFAQAVAADTAAGAGPDGGADFGALEDEGGRQRLAVTAIGSSRPASWKEVDGQEGAGRPPRGAAEAVLGRVVHRMFQRAARGDANDGELASLARALVREDEQPAVPDMEAFAARAAAVFARLWATPALRSLLDGAECLYEVPVSFVGPAPGAGAAQTVLRGVIDCLAVRPDGSVVVVDFKTGARRRSDRRQLNAYVDAARLLFPGAPVEGLLVYAV